MDFDFIYNNVVMPGLREISRERDDSMCVMCSILLYILYCITINKEHNFSEFNFQNLSFVYLI